MRFAANISTLFAELDFPDRIDAASASGFDAVECQFPYQWNADAIAGRLARAGLAMELINAPVGGPGAFGLAALEGKEREFRETIRIAADYAATLKVPRIHILAGRGPHCPITFARNLEWAACLLETCGLTALIEPLNALDMPDYALTAMDDAVAILTSLALPNLYLQLDLYHWQRQGYHAWEDLSPLVPLAAHVQFAAPADRGEPGSEDIELAARVVEAGYTGAIGCEYVPRGDTAAGLGWLRAARRRS